MTWRRRLRRYFLTGLVVITPVGATWLILAWLFRRLDAILGEPLQRVMPVRVPGLGLLLLLVVILLVGWLAYQTAGRRLIHAWDRMLVRFPLTAHIYRAASQIAQTLMGQQRRIVQRVVLIPFPTEGSWAVAFVTNEESSANDELGESHVHVFLPTTPNPTSGYLLIVRRDRVRDLNLSVEDAMKLIISGGAMAPQPGAISPQERGLDIARLFGDAEDRR